MMTSNYRCITIDLSTGAVGEEGGEEGDGDVKMYSNVMFTDIFSFFFLITHTHTHAHTHTHTHTAVTAADKLNCFAKSYIG